MISNRLFQHGLFILWAILMSCTNERSDKSNKGNESSRQTWDKIEIQYARNFAVIYHKDFKEVNIRYKSEGRDIDFEQQVLNQAGEADFWIINNTEDNQWPPAGFLNKFKAYRTGNVYNYQKRTIDEHDAYDWYETPEVRPDLVLKDLVSIFYPQLLPKHELLFFQKVILTKQTTSID